MKKHLFTLTSTQSHLYLLYVCSQTHTDLLLIQNEKRNREHFVVSCQVCRKSRSGSHTHTQVHTPSTHTKKTLASVHPPRKRSSLDDSRNGVNGKEKVISHCLSLNFSSIDQDVVFLRPEGSYIKVSVHL